MNDTVGFWLFASRLILMGLLVTAMIALPLALLGHPGWAAGVVCGGGVACLNLILTGVDLKATVARGTTGAVRAIQVRTGLRFVLLALGLWLLMSRTSLEILAIGLGLFAVRIGVSVAGALWPPLAPEGALPDPGVYDDEDEEGDW